MTRAKDPAESDQLAIQDSMKMLLTPIHVRVLKVRSCLQWVCLCVLAADLGRHITANDSTVVFMTALGRTLQIMRRKHRYSEYDQYT